MLRTIAASIPVVIGAVTVTTADNVKPVTPKDERAHYYRKPSELPIYVPLHANRSKVVEEQTEPSAIAKSIEEGVRVVRVQAFNAYNQIATQTNFVKDFLDTGKEHSKFIFEYLNEPENEIPRYGAIALGGLSGLIFALRGGIFKRLLYSSFGAGGMASICYPKEAGQYAQVGLSEAKRGVYIAYNFVAGVKPGDEVNLPKIPTSMSELSDYLSDLAKSALDAILPPKK